MTPEEKQLREDETIKYLKNLSPQDGFDLWTSAENLAKSRGRFLLENGGVPLVWTVFRTEEITQMPAQLAIYIKCVLVGQALCELIIEWRARDLVEKAGG